MLVGKYYSEFLIQDLDLIRFSLFAGRSSRSWFTGLTARLVCKLIILKVRLTSHVLYTVKIHYLNHLADFPFTEMEEGELRPPTMSGPTKRLEIVSKCKWATEDRRNVVLRTVCERMAQDRLKHPFWIGKYQIQPTSKTTKETDEGSIITYKVVISQPQVEESEEKKEQKRIKQLEAQLIETIGKSEVKGLPLLSQVTPAGLLKAEKKPSGALGQIMVSILYTLMVLSHMESLVLLNQTLVHFTFLVRFVWVCVGNSHSGASQNNKI